MNKNKLYASLREAWLKVRFGAARSDLRPFLIEIRYKSGKSVRFRCTEFTAGGGQVSWRNAAPRPLQIGINEIESIWQVLPVQEMGG